MPELPEIETIKSVVEPQIQGLTIKSVLVNRPEVIAHPTADDFCKEVMADQPNDGILCSLKKYVAVESHCIN